jgi:hypothetical protein
MPEDIHVIVANLLDFNADRIMSIPTRQDRMRAMILSFDSLPVSLFWNTGPKWSCIEGKGAGGNNQWIPSEPSKSELCLTPVMTVTAEWLELILGPGASAQVFSLHKDGIDIFEQPSFLCSGLSELVYNVTLLYAQSDEELAAQRSVLAGTPHYLIVEDPKLSSTPRSIKGALFRRLPTQNQAKDGVLQLSYCCPATLRALQRDLSLDERYAVAATLAPGTSVAVKYG